VNFVERIYPLRIFAVALSFPAVAVVLHQHAAPWHFWLLAVCNGFLWPHLAYFIASGSDRPTLAEYRNLVGDSAFAGMWAPLLSFNLLPSLAFLAVSGLSNMAAGGWRLFLKGLAASSVSMFVAWRWAVFVRDDFAFRLQPDVLILVATAPVIVVFPLFGRLAKQWRELEKISRTDALSRLNNRRYWEGSVLTEFERHKRSGSPLSLIMLDIDHFKQVNDEYGHVAGDRMIREISDLLTGTVRRADVVGRYGGEEFGVLLPDTGIEGAMQFAERLRLAVQALTLKPYGVHCTISLGVADANSEVRKYRELIENADEALYNAKRNGRNIAMAYESG